MEKGNKAEPVNNTQNIASSETKTRDSYEAGLDKRVQGGGAGLDEKVQGPKTETRGAGDFETKTISDGNPHQAGNRAGNRSKGIGDGGGKFPQAENGGASQEIFRSHLGNGDVQQTKTRGIGGEAGLDDAVQDKKEQGAGRQKQGGRSEATDSDP